MAHTRTQAETSTETKPFVQSEDGVTFRGGTMHLNGQAQVPSRVVHWGSSNGTTVYSTVEWLDQLSNERRTSCNCPGWFFKRGHAKVRSCCHTKDMEGTKVCTREKVDTVPIHSADEAVAAIPDIKEGRELRSIDLSDWD